MPVDQSYQVACKDFCGLALACKAGVCGACTSDTDCGRHESCVLDHCLDSSRVSCQNGATPTGLPPTVYLSSRPGESPNQFAQNRGSGGGFVVHGSLGTAATSPSD